MTFTLQLHGDKMLLLHIRFGKSVNLNDNSVNGPHSLVTGYKLCAYYVCRDSVCSEYVRA